MMKGLLWNGVFSLLFIGLVIVVMSILTHMGAVPVWISLFDFFLLVLATFRLTRLVGYDSIFAQFRTAFDGYESNTGMGTLRTLVHCPWCLGLWFGFFITTFYFLTPYAWFVILFLAISGLASFVQILANGLGWFAEGKKKEVSGE